MFVYLFGYFKWNKIIMPLSSFKYMYINLKEMKKGTNINQKMLVEFCVSMIFFFLLKTILMKLLMMHDGLYMFPNEPPSDECTFVFINTFACNVNLLAGLLRRQ